MATIQSLSCEYLKVPVAAFSGTEKYDPAGHQVSIAFSLSPTDTDLTWYDASWDQNGTQCVAKILVGVGGDVQLAPNVYRVWLRIVKEPETLVFLVPGSLIVT